MATSTSRDRRPAGSPAFIGGQFAPYSPTESDLSLTASSSPPPRQRIVHGFDPDLVEYDCERLDPDGMFRAQVYKVGGGTPGCHYEGRWEYRVTELDTVGPDHVFIEGETTNMGTRFSHEQVADMVISQTKSDLLEDDEWD